jgi:hypothetical protein
VVVVSSLVRFVVAADNDDSLLPAVEELIVLWYQ